jgi:hypothetical protein
VAAIEFGWHFFFSFPNFSGGYRIIGPLPPLRGGTDWRIQVMAGERQPDQVDVTVT